MRHQMFVKHIKVPEGQYQQYRVFADGFFDQNLNEGISFVDLDYDLLSYANKYGQQIKVDMFVFTNKNDYDCYVKAI